MEFKSGQQLFVNGKWYMDVVSVDGESIKVRIKFYEGQSKDFFQYKTIKLPSKLFMNCQEDSFLIRCTVNETELKKNIGSLINRLVKELDILKVFEDGMGAVANPGLSGTPGVPGSAGSGDINAGGILPPSEFGMQIHPKVNAKIRKKLKTKTGKPIVKQPVISLHKENVETIELDNTINSEPDYKLNLYQFLDYPTDNEYDIKFIDTINKWRPTFLEISSQRIKQYFKDLYNVNKSLIKDKTSEWFQNNILILGEITDIED